MSSSRCALLLRFALEAPKQHKTLELATQREGGGGKIVNMDFIPYRFQVA